MSVKLAQYGVLHAHASGKAQVIEQSPDVDFCGVYESDPEARAAAASTSVYEGVHWFESKEEMLEDDSIVGIAVEGRVCDNLPFAREVIEHGKHVWLDKPAGVDLDEFRKIVVMAREKEVLIQLGYMFRYNAGFQFILDWAKDGKLGDIFCARARMSTNVAEETRQRLGEYGGGILFELCCHVIDIIVSLLDRPNRVTSFLRNDLGTTPLFSDNTVAVFEYEKAIAIIESAAMEVNAFPSRRIEVYGTRGSAILEPFEPPSLRLCLDQDRDGHSKGWQAVEVEDRPRYVASLEAFAADILGEKKPDRSLDHELLVQETVLRASGVIQFRPASFRR